MTSAATATKPGTFSILQLALPSKPVRNIGIFLFDLDTKQLYKKLRRDLHTFVDPENRAAMLSDGAVAWLDLPLERVIERVPADGRRPLAADRVQMEHLYARRRAAYSQAHVRIDASRPLPEIVERILEWIDF